jgi:exonuclease III
MDLNKIIVWNVQGLNSVVQKNSVCTLVEAARADIVCIQETKIAGMSQQVILSALGLGFTNFCELPAVGASGGILIAWKHHVQTTGNSRIDTNNILI